MESGWRVLVRLLFVFPPSGSSNLTFDFVHFQPLISSSRFGAPTTANSRRRLRVISWASAMWRGAATVAYSSPPATTRRWKSGNWAAAKAWRPSKVTAITSSVATSIRKAISSCRVVSMSRCESGMLERESVWKPYRLIPIRCRLFTSIATDLSSCRRATMDFVESGTRPVDNVSRPSSTTTTRQYPLWSSRRMESTFSLLLLIIP